MRTHASIAFLLTLAGCPDSALARDAYALESIGCAGPDAFGAVPDDGLDDVAAIQEAIDNCDGGALTFPDGGGTYTIAPPPATGDWRTSSLHIIHSLTLDLNGAALSMEGDNISGDWYLLHVGRNPYPGQPATANVVIRDGYLLKGETLNTSEQTHLIQVGHSLAAAPDGVYGVELSGLSLYLPAGGQPAGDCIRLLGEVTTPDEFIRIHNNVFLDCARSGVSFQRGTRKISVTDNHFISAGNSLLDFEPTSLGAVSQTVIANNVFGSSGSDWAVSLSGSDNALSTDIVFEGNVLTDGGLDSYNLGRTVIADNVIATASAQHNVQVIKAGSELSFTGNRIHRLAGSTTQAVVNILHHNSGTPGKLLIVGNEISTDVASAPLNLQSVQDVLIGSNRLTTTQAGGPAVISVNATIRDVDRLLVSGNLHSGPALAFVRLTASGSWKVGATSVVGNMSSGALTYGIQCQGAGLLSKALVHASNFYDGATTAIGCTAAHGLVTGAYP